MTTVGSRRGGLLGPLALVLRGTGAAPAVAASLVARLALGTTGLSLLLLVQGTTGSYAVGGAVSAAFAVAFACVVPALARRADRRGPRGVLLTCALLHPCVLVATVLLARAGAPAPVLVLSALLAGACVPPVSGVVRALWARLVREEDLPTAYSLESIVVELCFVSGPLLVAGLTAVAGPSAAVLAGAVLVLTGGLWLAATPAVRAVVPHERPAGGAAGPLGSGAVRALLLTVACVGAGFGAVEVCMPAFVESHDARPGAAGVLLAVFSAGSIVGGLLYGAVRPRAPHAQQLAWLVLGLAVGTALPLLAPGPVAMGAALAVYGLAVAPFMTCTSVLLGAAAPPGTATEAFAWSSSMVFGGVALGSAVAGVLVEGQGVAAGLLLVAATGVATLLAGVGARPLLSRV